MLTFSTPARRLRSVALLEGVSFLVLLFVAMPLKYLAGRPLAVSIVGSLHGALFLWLVALVWQGVDERGKGRRWGARILIASLLPFGPFAIDDRLRRECAEEAP